MATALEGSSTIGSDAAAGDDGWVAQIRSAAWLATYLQIPPMAWRPIIMATTRCELGGGVAMTSDRVDENSEIPANLCSNDGQRPV